MMCGSVHRGYLAGVLPEAAVQLAVDKGWITQDQADAIIAGDENPCG